MINLDTLKSMKELYITVKIDAMTLDDGDLALKITSRNDRYHVNPYLTGLVERLVIPYKDLENAKFPADVIDMVIEKQVKDIVETITGRTKI